MNLQELVAYCGLTCKSCPIYWATREENKLKHMSQESGSNRFWLGQNYPKPYK